VLKSDGNINCTNDTENMLTKVPDNGVVGVDVRQPVAVCLVIVVSGTVDDVGCGESVVVVICMDPVTGSVQIMSHILFPSVFFSFVQRLVVS